VDILDDLIEVGLDVIQMDQQENMGLELLNEMNSGDNKGILLDSLHFKKGQTVTIRGQLGAADQLYKFQENLLTKKGIRDVTILSAAPDSKTKKIKFTMTFHYKTYTKRSGRR